MKNTTKSYLLISILAIYGLIKNLILNNSLSAVINEEILTVFWITLCFLSIIIIKYPKDRSYYKAMSYKTIIIALLFTLFVSYLLGFFVGFIKNVYSQEIVTMISNLIPIVLYITSKEIVRYIIAKNSVYKKLPIIMFTIISILLSILDNNINFSNAEQIFMTTCTIILPVIASELLCSYLAYNFGLGTTLLYLIPKNIYVYIFPFLPNLGEYITSVIEILMPFSIYLAESKYVAFFDKEGSKTYKKSLGLMFAIPVIIFLVIIVFLVSGVFKYKMIAIASDSMNPVYKRGDAVIYEKIDDIDDIELDDILVFTKEGKTVTHRVKKISNIKNKKVFKTKGDNNVDFDNFDVYESEVLGRVKYVIVYIGYPSVWIGEKFKGA